MKLLLAAAAVVALSTPCEGYDRSRVLLSDRTVICSPGTPAAAVRHLVETCGALVCTWKSDDMLNDRELLPWVGVRLALGPDSATAVDSLIVWKDRLHLSTAVVSDHSWLAGAARKAGLRVFTQIPEFRQGALAIPEGDHYVYYDGPAPVFFDRTGYLEERLADSRRSRQQDGWTALATSLHRVFRADTAAVSRWPTLLDATHQADSLGALADTDVRARAYGERWRYCLAWWLSPEWVPDTLVLFEGQEHELGIRIRGGEGTVTLAGIQCDTSRIAVTWQAPWPVEIPAGTQVELSGRFRAEHPCPAQWQAVLELRFGSFRFSRPLAVLLQVQTLLQAEFVPPVLFPNAQPARTGPEETMQEVSGQLELVNQSSSALKLQLAWRVEAPLKFSSAAGEIDLAALERRLVGYTLSVPRELEYKEYGFGVDVSAEGAHASTRGQFWKETPARTGAGLLGAVGCSPSWLSALPCLGLKTQSLVPGSLGPRTFTPIDAVVIRRLSPASEDDAQAMSDFVQQGGVAILEMDRSALEWLPWAVSTVKRPGPFAASFYKENLDWWQAPNVLVGGCFAAAGRDSVLTLVSGSIDWEPLVVDDQGKGFMYRRKHGSGWYVLVHSGWWRRLEQLERRAHLGLFNLASAAAR